MLIRSQNKDMLFDYQNAYIDRVGACLYLNPYSIDMTNSGICLGCYSTKEKALKVLDYTSNAYAECQAKYGGMVEYKYLVFEMPQEEEI